MITKNEVEAVDSYMEGSSGSSQYCRQAWEKIKAEIVVTEIGCNNCYHESTEKWETPCVECSKYSEHVRVETIPVKNCNNCKYDTIDGTCYKATGACNNYSKWQPAETTEIKKDCNTCRFAGNERGFCESHGRCTEYGGWQPKERVEIEKECATCLYEDDAKLELPCRTCKPGYLQWKTK